MYLYHSYEEYRRVNSKDCHHRFTVIEGKRIVCLDCGEEVDEVDPDESLLDLYDLFK